MTQLIMTYGLPGSGKSTWARKQVGFVRVNKDDLRDMLHGGKWSRENEKQVLAARDALIEHFLGARQSVIVDDTNLAPVHLERLRVLARKYNVPVVVKDFSHVAFEECVKRDALRVRSVGERIIRDMYDRYLRKAETYVPPEGKPVCVIVDLDGTLAVMNNNRGPYEDHLCETDELCEVIADIVKAQFGKGDRIVLMSGRDEGRARDATIRWLDAHQIPWNLLIMRNAGDTRKDSVVKRELFEEHVRNEYQVRFVLDDREQVVEMWRDLGLTCLQVADGRF